jgi:SMI1/KNR4 family protein SUKH-1/tetratricopeptide repeat protein
VAKGRTRAGRQKTAGQAPGGGTSDRSPDGAALFFEGFRTACARAPAGLMRPGPPAAPADIAAAGKALGRPIPESYAAFLRSFDGADLFHESMALCGVGAGRSLLEANRPPLPATLLPGELVFAETAGGDRYAFDRSSPPRVLHLRAGSDERWLAGSSFPRWLDALLARELLLYDPEGEFVLEAFEPDGEELTPVFARRQAERALRKDPDSAESHHDLAVALRRSGPLPQAREHFERATDLDPDNPWPWFDRARAELADGAPAQAVASFRRAADATPGPEGARFLAWAARAALDAVLPAEAARARQDAVARDPEVMAALERAAAAAEDDAARAEAAALVEAMTARKRLPLLRS